METKSNMRMSIEEAGAILGLGRTASYNANKRGEIPGVVKVGRNLIVIRPVFLKSIGLDESAPLVDQHAQEAA